MEKHDAAALTPDGYESPSIRVLGDFRQLTAMSKSGASSDTFKSTPEPGTVTFPSGST